jgi:hypothetical protein
LLAAIMFGGGGMNAGVTADAGSGNGADAGV